MWYLSFSFWFTSLSMIISRSILVAAHGIIAFFLWLCSIPSYIHILHLLYPFLCLWTLRLLPCLEFCKQLMHSIYWDLSLGSPSGEAGERKQTGWVERCHVIMQTPQLPIPQYSLELEWSFRVVPSWAERARALYCHISQSLELVTSKSGMTLVEAALYSWCSLWRGWQLRATARATHPQ